MSTEDIAVIASAAVAVVSVVVHARLSYRVRPRGTKHCPICAPPEPGTADAEEDRVWGGATDGEEDWQNR